MIDKGVVREFGRLIGQAEKEAIDSMKDGKIETEPSITDRLSEKIEQVFKQHVKKNSITFDVRVLRDRGPGASERKYGADVCAVLNVNMQNFKIAKGFLAQSKMEGRGIKVHTSNYRGTTVDIHCDESLREQTDKMLSVTPDSFVFIYSQDGFVVVPALSVNALAKRGRIYGKTLRRFFMDYLECFIGDHRLKAFDDDSLEVLRNETNARLLFLFDIRTDFGYDILNQVRFK